MIPQSYSCNKEENVRVYMEEFFHNNLKILVFKYLKYIKFLNFTQTQEHKCILYCPWYFNKFSL